MSRLSVPGVPAGEGGRVSLIHDERWPVRLASSMRVHPVAWTRDVREFAGETFAAEPWLMTQLALCLLGEAFCIIWLIITG